MVTVTPLSPALGAEIAGVDLSQPLDDVFREQAGLAFASLPADVADGSLVYCSDCGKGGNHCAGAGTGAIAQRLNNVWRCD